MLAQRGCSFLGRERTPSGRRQDSPQSHSWLWLLCFKTENSASEDPRGITQCRAPLTPGEPQSWSRICLQDSVPTEATLPRDQVSEADDTRYRGPRTPVHTRTPRFPGSPPGLFWWSGCGGSPMGRVPLVPRPARVASPRPIMVFCLPVNWQRSPPRGVLRLRERKRGGFWVPCPRPSLPVPGSGSVAMRAAWSLCGTRSRFLSC